MVTARKLAVLAAKDLRHAWPPLVAIIPLLFVFATQDVQRLILHKSVFAATLWQVMYLATPLAICSFVAMLIHAESLVGDRQYWLTRPFTWRHLAASKTILVALCINLPLFLFQAIALAANGVSPVTYLPDLLWRQVFFAALLLLPAAALAAVTRTLGQFALSILLAVSPFAALLWFEWNDPFVEGGQWMDAVVLGFVLSAGAATILGLQYARRRTALSRAILTTVFAACFALLMFNGTGIVATFPASRSIRLSLDRSPRPPSKDWTFNRAEAIELALVAEGMPPDTEPAINDSRLTIVNPELPDRPARAGAVQLHGWRDGRGYLQIVLSPATYRRLAGRPVNISGQLDLTLMRIESDLETAPDTVQIAGFGVCTRSQKLCFSPQPHAALSFVSTPAERRSDLFGRIVPVPDTFAPFPCSPLFYPLKTYYYDPTYGTLLVERPAGRYRFELSFKDVNLEDFARPY